MMVPSSLIQRCVLTLANFQTRTPILLLVDGGYYTNEVRSLTAAAASAHNYHQQTRFRAITCKLTPPS